MEPVIYIYNIYRNVSIIIIGRTKRFFFAEEYVIDLKPITEPVYYMACSHWV